MNDEELKRNYAYHKPNEEKVLIHEKTRKYCYDLALLLNGLPESREKSLALTKLEEVMMWANACIARNND